MAGGVSGYAAIKARVRIVSSALLTVEEWAELSQAMDLSTLVGLLKHYAYGRYVDMLKDKNLTARGLAYQFRSRLADVFQSVIHATPRQARPMQMRLYRYYEVNNL